ncbi:unnamed protein product [Sphagnum troendelagicum]|uniref:Uncharacterized protein n=1 Tax=Sphagnum troendelagicum TaxID=128251 RepID=A0ABP0TLW1_9BRYO
MEKEKEGSSSSRRSWPWKKKSSDKVAASLVSSAGAASPNSSSFFDDPPQQQQQRWGLNPRNDSAQISPHKDVSARMLQHHTRAANEARQQSGERVKSVSEQLADALADITMKDNLVKQQAKVAEEAVCGWEKAVAEAVALKQQLDTALQEKLATEDRAAHLDGALKECMKQLRHVREEQEQLLHDTLVKKTREYDKLRVEMETKLAEASQILSQTRTELLESRAEGKALSNALQVRLEAMEKENSSLKFNVHVLNKELEIRSQEREDERKAADNAGKQQHESVKKIAKLEEECSRLRILIRKKLPGPAALQRMRHEVEGLGKVDGVENRWRRSMGRSASHLDPGSVAMMQENLQDMGYDGASVIAEKMVSIDEEMKMLKEALARRNEELHNAHITCAKTANRLALVQEELDRALGLQNQSKRQDVHALIKGSPRSVEEINGDASSDAWASALVAELDQFKKKSKPHSNGNNDSKRASLSFELMDDFVEMERLAKMSEPAKSENTYSDTASFDGPRESALTTASDQIQELECALASTRQELESANTTVHDLNAKLATAEENLAALQTKNSANETLLTSLQDQLGRLNEIHSDMEKGGDGPPALLDQMSGFSIKDILARGKESASTAHTELAASISKIVQIIETLAQATGSEHTLLVSKQIDDISEILEADLHKESGQIAQSMHWKDAQLENGMQSLVLAGNKLLEGKADMVDFISELSLTLEGIMLLKPFKIPNQGTKCDSKLAEHAASAKMNLDGLSCIALPPNKELEAGETLLEEEFPTTLNQSVGANAEVGNLRTEKSDNENHLKAQEETSLSDQDRLQDDTTQGSEGLKEDELLEEELMVLSSANPRLVSDLQAVSGEMNHLHDKVAALEVQLQDERQQHQEVITKLEDLQHQIHKYTNVLALRSSFEREDREIAAAALAECQRTILALGKQLKGMGAAPVAREPTDTLVDSSTDSGKSIEKLTQSMEFLRWQTEAEVVPYFPDIANTHNHSPSALRERSSPWVTTPELCTGGNQSPLPIPGRRQNGQQGHADKSFYTQKHEENGAHKLSNNLLNDGVGTVPPPSPGLSDFLGHGSMSVPPSPARSPAPVLWSLRNRTNNGPKSLGEDSVLEETPPQKPRTSSTFSRFYSRSRSGSSGSSG